MLNREEIIAIAISILVLSVSVSLLESIDKLLSSFIIVFLIIVINIVPKKITSYYLDSQIELRLWEIRQYGFSPGKKFKKPFPAGAFFPIIISAFSLGLIKWMASLVFDVKAKVYRAAKRHGLYSFSEMSEFHIGLIAASGIAANLVFSIIGYLIGFQTFAKISIFFVLFNMLPLSSLDGNKIFFGNTIIWGFLAALTLIGLTAVFLVV